ncbi:MAG: type II secretion system protein [Marinobacter sp.]|nr:type II secretion system protein [Marinobacter sp.]
MLRQRGFTLVELVMVIVLLGIVATISTQFVSLSVRGAIDLGDRQQRALQGVVISEQVTREVRNAFPLSVRESGECLEWLPIRGGTTYQSLPAGSGGNKVEILPFGREISAGSRLIVYGYGSSQGSLYESGASVPNPGPVSPPIEQVDPGDVEIAFADSETHRFRERSPQKRIYAVGNAISVCQKQDNNSTRLYRFTDYKPDTSGPRSFDWLSANADDSGVMSANMVKNSLIWKVVPASLQRSAVVNFEFELFASGSDETTHVNQEVHIRNVP